jgi:hypothetical protein
MPSSRWRRVVDVIPASPVARMAVVQACPDHGSYLLWLATSKPRLRITRTSNERFDAGFVCPVMIIPCAGARDEETLRSCPKHSSAAIPETCDHYGAIHRRTRPVGAREMDGGYPLPRSMTDWATLDQLANLCRTSAVDIQPLARLSGPVRSRRCASSPCNTHWWHVLIRTRR